MAAAQVAAVLLLALHGAYALPRGVDPSQAAHYEGKGGTFTCLDGSKTIPLSQVNDNYCDCPSDGSDEPGSSACYWGKFYCANRGHQPQFLSASFVDDGICDCCDGADELVGCRNTCLDKGATERQVVRDKAEQMKRSLETKQRLISDGVTRRAGWSTRASSIDTEIAQLEKEVARIEDEKTAAQAAADEDRKRLQQEEEERQRQATEAQAKAAEDAVQAAGAAGDATGAEETDEERGRRIASQWTNDPDAAGVPAEGEPEVIEGDVEDAGHVGHEEYEGHHDYTPTPPGDYAHSPSHQHIYSPLDSKVYQLNADLSAAKAKLQELTNEKVVIQRYHSSGIKFDYGPGGNFLPLAGRCISDVGTRWTYEACFFDAAIQKEPHNPNNKVSLGTWRGWDNDYTEAVFDNGDPCAGAPNRSLRVKLFCGDEERMYGGEEPATCLYTVSLTTPLACNQSDLDKEHAKLAELERFEAEIRAEIEAAEKSKAAAAGDRTEL